MLEENKIQITRKPYSNDAICHDASLKEHIRLLYGSIKGKKIFGDFISSFYSLNRLAYDKNSYKSLVKRCLGRNYIWTNHDALIISNYYETSDKLLKSLVGRIVFFNCALRPKKYPLQSAIDKQKDVLDAYITDEVKRLNLKAYPTETFFSFLFGTIFATIGFIIIVTILAALLSTWIALMFSITVLITSISLLKYVYQFQFIKN